MLFRGKLWLEKKEFTLSSAQLILLSFLVTVLAGIVLLTLQVSSAIGKAVRYLDALLTATAVTCVTALVTLPYAIEIANTVKLGRLK